MEAPQTSLTSRYIPGMKHQPSQQAQAKPKLDQTVCFRISKHDFDRFVNLIHQTKGSSTSPMAREVFAAGLDALGAPPSPTSPGSTGANPLLEQISRQLPLEREPVELEAEADAPEWCGDRWCATCHERRKTSVGR